MYQEYKKNLVFIASCAGLAFEGIIGNFTVRFLENTQSHRRSFRQIAIQLFTGSNGIGYYADYDFIACCKKQTQRITTVIT